MQNFYHKSPPFIYEISKSNLLLEESKLLYSLIKIAMNKLLMQQHNRIKGNRIIIT